MSISEQVKELRDLAGGKINYCEWKKSEMLKEAADTIESLSAKLSAANMERCKHPTFPCDVGETVYSFSYGKVLVLRVQHFTIYQDRTEARLVSDMDEYKFLSVDLDIADFGKKWFKTKEEAETAAKEPHHEP